MYFECRLIREEDMPSEQESRSAQIERFEQQLGQLQERYNTLEVNRTRLQQQKERLVQQYSKLEMRLNRLQQQLERVMTQQAALLGEQQQLEQLLALLKQQNGEG